MPWCLESSSPAACWLRASRKTDLLRRSLRPQERWEMQGKARSSPPYMRRPLRAKWSCHRKADVQKVDLPGSYLHDTQKDVSVCFSFDLFILGERENIICKLMALMACVHLYSKMTSPHRHMCATFNHFGATLTSCCMYMYMANYWSVFLRWTPASMWLWDCMCGKMYLLCVCTRTCEGEGSDLELIRHRYPSLYRLIPVKTE